MAFGITPRIGRAHAQRRQGSLSSSQPPSKPKIIAQETVSESEMSFGNR
jgi:hypothetical protein